MIKIVLTQKYSPSSYCWKNLEKKKKIQNVSLEKLLNKYQGFEGELIKLIEVNETFSEIKNEIIQCLEIYNPQTQILSYILHEENCVPQYIEEQSIFVGYEIGVCEKEKTLFSSIFNEILFGKLEQLVFFKEKLNENFLFSDKKSAEKYITLHNQLSAQGMDVEDYEKIHVLEVWKFRT